MNKLLGILIASSLFACNNPNNEAYNKSQLGNRNASMEKSNPSKIDKLKSERVIELVIEKHTEFSYNKTQLVDSLHIKTVRNQENIISIYRKLKRKKPDLKYCSNPNPPDFKLVFKLTDNAPDFFWVDTSFYAYEKQVVIFPYDYNGCTKIPKSLWEKLLL